MINAKALIIISASLVSCALEPGIKNDSEYVRYINEHRGTVESIIKKTERYTSSDSAAAMAAAAPAAPKGYEQPLKNLRVLYINGSGGDVVGSAVGGAGAAPSAQAGENHSAKTEGGVGRANAPSEITGQNNWQCPISADKNETWVDVDSKKNNKPTAWPRKR